jgi:hypothetical protein
MGIETHCYGFIILWFMVVLTYGLTRKTVEDELLESFTKIYGEADVFFNKLTDALTRKFTEEFIKIALTQKQASQN